MNVPLATDASLPVSGDNRASRRLTFLKWLRKTHGWIGLWGATLGLLFGTSGIMLNHRAVLKIPAAQTQESNFQVALPSSPPGSAHDMASWLQHELKLTLPPPRVRTEPSHPVAWGDAQLRQPEHWLFTFASPTLNIQADYWVGNGYVTVKRGDNNFFATLTQLHKGVGVSIGWILLVDTLAGGIIMLSLTGFTMWFLLNKGKTLGLAIALCGLTMTLGLALQAIGIWR